MVRLFLFYCNKFLQKERKQDKDKSGKAMTGQQLCEAAHEGDITKVSTLLSTEGVKSFINYQNGMGLTPFHCRTPIFQFLFSVGRTYWEKPLPIA
jgi:hypothetical protein